MNYTSASGSGGMQGKAPTNKRSLRLSWASAGYMREHVGYSL